MGIEHHQLNTRNVEHYIINYVGKIKSRISIIVDEDSIDLLIVRIVTEIDYTFDNHVFLVFFLRKIKGKGKAGIIIIERVVLG